MAELDKHAAPAVFDDRICLLGEGPLWHPERGQLFWFDILGKALLSRDAAGRALEWRFPEMVSAAGWVDARRLLVASQSALSLFDLETGAAERLVALEADDPLTRSNDGRADPYGGFWIGTMGLDCEPGLGAIYRYHRGELRKLLGGVAISNAICFSPDGGEAYLADTATCRVMRWRLDGMGWPKGEPELFLNLTAEGLKPDGAVVDAEGRFWNAHWGSGLLCAYDRDGREVARFSTGAPHLTCPAFGGPDLDVIYLTSASDLPAEDLARHPNSGKTFALRAGAVGQREHRVVL